MCWTRRQKKFTILPWVIDTGKAVVVIQGGQGGICLGPDGMLGIFLIVAHPILTVNGQVHCCSLSYHRNNIALEARRPRWILIWAQHLLSLWITTYLWFSVSYVWNEEAKQLISKFFFSITIIKEKKKNRYYKHDT